MKISFEEVKKFLPHREPFLFVDSIESITLAEGRTLAEGETVVAKELINSVVVGHYKTKEDHPIFAGHFPGNPILPGVVQVEMMAQISSFGLTSMFKDPFNQKMEVALLSVTDAKFRKPVYPGMDLVIKTTCSKSRGSFLTNLCEIYHNDELMSQATTMATVTFE